MIDIKKKTNEDVMEFSTVDLALPASTDIKSIVHQYELAKQTHKEGMIVFFSTSIDSLFINISSLSK